MNLKFLFPHWGGEGIDPRRFITFCIEHQFDSIEVNFLLEKKIKF
jgi:hypothetical protein